MTKNDFVALLKEHAVSRAVDNVSNYLEEPCGRNPDSEILEISEWFKNLSERDRKNIKRFAHDVAEECLFGICAVLDGVRVVDSETECFEVNSVTYDAHSTSLVGDIDLHDLC